MLKLLLVAVMGGIGSLARYLVTLLMQHHPLQRFPTGTFVVNVAGCFIAGLLVSYLAAKTPAREEYRIALVVGLMGGFTTFSSLGVETIGMLRRGQNGMAFTYVGASVVLGLLACWCGHRLALALVRA